MNEHFPGGGETGALLRITDWAQTSLGPVDSWPVALTSLARAILHSRQPMLLWWGPELIQLYNDAMVPSLATKHPAAIGQRARDSWREVWPVVGEQLERVVSQGDAIWNEDMLVPVFRSGQLEDAWWIYSYSPVFDDEGKRAGILIICTETTHGVIARRQLEEARKTADLAREELHGAFMQAPLPIAILMGSDHRFVLANAAYETLVSRSVVGKTLLQAFSEAEAGYYGPYIERVYRTGEPVLIREAELRLYDVDGLVIDRYIDVGYHPYRSSDGSTLGIIAIINDVTAFVVARRASERQEEERAAMLAREQQLRCAAEASGRARDEFFAMLGHELRNPLAPIVTATQLMRMRGNHHEKERLIIERQVAHLSRLVEDLLDVARVTQGKVELRLAPVEVADVLGKAIETVSPLLEQRSHELRLNVPREGLAIHGDRTRLVQVFANLVSNAAKYTPPQGRIEVTASRQDDEIVVDVCDNGPGIDENLRPHVFDLFVQGRQSLDRSLGGLGLGLALVKNLVTLHGGSVAVENVPGGGSRFTVRVPALGTAAHHFDVKGGEQPSIARKTASRRILVVDDNDDAAELVAEVLRSVGHDVAVAHDGPQALELLRTFHPDVGLLDIGLPGMDGLELARRMRELPLDPLPRLIAITGYGQAHDREKSRIAGFDAHLTKPVALNDLVRVIAAGQD